MIKNKKSFIVGIKGKKLNRREITFLKNINPGALYFFQEILILLNKQKTLQIILKKFLKTKIIL